MDEPVIEASVQLNEFTIVKLRDGRIRYIKEFFTKEDVESKEKLDVTSVYIVLPPRLDLTDLAVFEDEKSSIDTKDIQAIKQIILKGE
jgi:hypothetical protein